jgi:hypothetical protein
MTSRGSNRQDSGSALSLASIGNHSIILSNLVTDIKNRLCYKQLVNLNGYFIESPNHYGATTQQAEPGSAATAGTSNRAQTPLRTARRRCSERRCCAGISSTGRGSLRTGSGTYLQPVTSKI